MMRDFQTQNRQLQNSASRAEKLVTIGLQGSSRPYVEKIRIPSSGLETRKMDINPRFHYHERRTYSREDCQLNQKDSTIR